MRILFKFLIFLSVGLASHSALAIFEIRINYGVLASKQSISDICIGCSNASGAPDMAPNYGIGADAIVKVPVLSLGFGLGVRYENLGFTASAGGIEAKASNTRTALLLNYRLIDTLIFIGPIVSYGLSHSGNLQITENGSKILDYSTGTASSYSIGLEAGLKLIAFNVGAEVGYLDERWKDAKSEVGAGAIKDINLSGSYAKIHLGFGF